MQIIKRVRVAFLFLTRIPVGEIRDFKDGDLAASVIYFPVVGLTIGFLMAAFEILTQNHIPDPARAGLLTVFPVYLTGALHLDGLMDFADGMAVPRSKKKVLEIMKDSSVGAYGVAAAVSLLLMKYTFISSLTSQSRILALLLAPGFSRWMLVLALLYFPPAAATSSLGVKFTGKRSFLRFLGSGIVLLLPLFYLMGGIGLLAAAWIIALTLIFSLKVKRRLDGLTGDCCGALHELVEVAFLFFVIVFWG